MATVFGPMSLGEMIDELEKVRDKDACVVFDWCDMEPSEFRSYRGYYEHLVIVPAGSIMDNTVKSFLNKCKDCVGKTFTGYKGGDFRMGRKTPVWIGYPSRATGYGVEAVEEDTYGRIILKTRKYVD